jgi:GT2 family glycosyltransferase
LAIDGAGLRGPGLVVVIGSRGIACRTIDLGAPATEYLHIAERRRVGLHTRRYVHRCLGLRAGGADRAAAALQRDLQLVSPDPVRRLDQPGKPVGGALDLAIPAGDGVFFAGWLHDSHGMIDQMSSASLLGEHPVPAELLHRVPRSVPAAGEPLQVPTGQRFVAYLPGVADGSLQHRLKLTLTSGGGVDLVAPMPPIGFAAARHAVLGSVPVQYLKREILSGCLAPAASALHAALMAEQGAPEIVEIGSPLANPVVSVIVPLYRNLSFLRFQLAAFAVDPAFRMTELIYVLDSPEQRGEVEHLLRAYHAIYALPIRLVVMSANFGYAAANNTGARTARGCDLLLLNSDVIPEQPGWLDALRAVLDTHPSTGAVGPKLLFEDGSLQHAGLYFGRDARGDWLNMHFHKGFPRDFPAANQGRAVPGITGAAMLIRRAVFEAVGGFTEDFIIGDYEDSDLCLKLRRAGCHIRYEPAAELYHFERRSISLHAGYARTVASEYNRWLHTSRWHADMLSVARGEPVPVIRTTRTRRRAA